MLRGLDGGTLDAGRGCWCVETHRRRMSAGTGVGREVYLRHRGSGGGRIPLSGTPLSGIGASQRHGL